jgi:hypothetical protein
MFVGCDGGDIYHVIYDGKIITILYGDKMLAEMRYSVGRLYITKTKVTIYSMLNEKSIVFGKKYKITRPFEAYFDSLGRLLNANYVGILENDCMEYEFVNDALMVNYHTFTIGSETHSCQFTEINLKDLNTGLIFVTYNKFNIDGCIQSPIFEKCLFCSGKYCLSCVQCHTCSINNIVVVWDAKIYTLDSANLHMCVEDDYICNLTSLTY